ncbi:MAG: hypothetical protein O2854_09120 [Chloroflexi bacterium]|nr:hypothetical protein [Chloroflexota bacterium]
MSHPTAICIACYRGQHPHADRANVCGEPFYQEAERPVAVPDYLTGILRWQCACLCEQAVESAAHPWPSSQ